MALLHNSVRPLGRESCPSRHVFQRQLSTEVITLDLKNSMLRRRLPVIAQIMTVQNSRLLQTTLKDFLPSRYQQVQIPLGIHSLPISHFQVYHPPRNRLSSLSEDGTDPRQSPGQPFTRRMWAGGELEKFREVKYFPAASRCQEEIVDVTTKGAEGEEKVYVKIRRNVIVLPRATEIPNGWRDATTILTETRSLVFMREGSGKASAQASPRSVVKPPNAPDFSYTLMPTPALLFRFSALTFNSHAIHLDKQYCVEKEGHRNLVVHGPLSLVLMMELLRAELGPPAHVEKDASFEVVNHVEYRNLAPLYAEEEMTICARKKEEGIWETWIQGPDGGLAVRATAKTNKILMERRKGDKRQKEEGEKEKERERE
ncbi:MAG: hypothetical protein LQ351_002418 [Letrouitia transgressa]|nr:MAG: hypothetical protein LQ351_002418 [Letrouitia transgressa]